MSMALLFALLLPVLQDDPQVSYREGLFEEVDQGNLDKAVELYAKVLKSGAPDALKAKALLRTGLCHEKKGKKKEAEQAWRDVAERYPGAAETVKLAKERLASQLQAESAGGLTLDTQVQNLILDLGSEDNKVRGEAIRKLVLLGDTVIPEVKNALLHRDAQLSAGAAIVLMRMEQIDGVYETLKKSWAGRSSVSYASLTALGELLRTHEASRARFLKELGELKFTYGVSTLANTFMNIPDPAFPRLVEDWIVANPKEALSMNVLQTWTARTTDETSYVRLAQRLSDGEANRSGVLVGYLNTLSQYRDLSKTEKVRSEIGNLLVGWHDLGLLFPPEGDMPHWVHSYVTPADLGNRLMRNWFKRATPEIRSRMIRYAGKWSNVQQGEEFNRFLLDQISSPDVSIELRNQIYEVGASPKTAEDRQKLISFGMAYLKQGQGKPDDERPLLTSVLWRLLELLPDDSKELPTVLDMTFDHFWDHDQLPQPARAEERRALVVQGALRTFPRKTKGIKMALRTLEPLGEPADKAKIGASILDWPRDVKELEDSLGFAIQIYCDGVLNLPESERDAAWKELRQVYSKADARVQIAFLNGCSGRKDPRIDALMTDAASSPSEPMRVAAVQHWSTQEGAVPALLRALDDKSEDVRLTAINTLGLNCTFEAVPKLIRFMEDPSENLRSASLEALKLIRQHYEERTQWQRWYDETKKALNK